MQQSPHRLPWDAPNLPPKLPLPFRSYTNPSTDPTQNPKWHPDPISRFATVHFRTNTDRQTDRPTDRRTGGICDRSAPLALTLAILIESDALFVHNCRLSHLSVCRSVRKVYCGKNANGDGDALFPNYFWEDLLIFKRSCFEDCTYIRCCVYACIRLLG